MPLSLFCAWLVSHTLGSHEWQLRAVNVLWGAVALLGMYRVGKRLQLPWLPVLLAIQPYFWFYSNEARPYALQMACGAWLLAGLTDFIASQGTGESWVWEFSVASIILCLTTMLAPLPVAVAVAAGGIVAFKDKWKLHRKTLAVLVGGAIAAIPIGLYYLSTLSRGASGAKLWHVDLKFFGYVLYETTGMVGLGPSVESIRELARSPHFYSELLRSIYQFLLPAAFSLALLSVFVFGLRKSPAKSKNPFLISITFVLTVTCLIFVVVGICIQKAFWARHFAPVVPFYVALLGIAIAGMEKRKLQSALVFLLIGLLTLSSLNIRFGPHRKEDFRQAAQIARTALAENKSVYWSASVFGIQYYHLDYSFTPETGKVFSPMRADVTKLPLPDLIVYYSKPESFDSSGAIQKIIRENGYRPVKSLNSFVIYSR